MQADKYWQKHNCPNVWKRSQTAGRARDDRADHQRRQNQNNPKQAKQKESTDMMEHQKSYLTERLYRSASSPVHHRHHEITRHTNKNDDWNPKDKKGNDQSDGRDWSRSAHALFQEVRPKGACQN